MQPALPTHRSCVLKRSTRAAVFTCRTDAILRLLWLTALIVCAPLASSAAPRLVADINQQPASSFPRQFAFLGDRVLFGGVTPSGPGLWIASLEGDELVRLAEVSAREIATVGNDRAFLLVSAAHGSSELWLTDGSTAGTRRVAATGGAASQLTILGELVCFVVQNR